MIDAIWQQGVHDVITFQLWVRRDVDVVCAHVPLSGSVGAYRFSLDGLGSSTQGVVEAIACELATPASRIIGLVIDRDGQSDDHHWDEAIRRAASGVSLGGVSAFVRYGESA